jgi:hypothetical protein
MKGRNDLNNSLGKTPKTDSNKNFNFNMDSFLEGPTKCIIYSKQII